MLIDYIDKLDEAVKREKLNITIITIKSLWASIYPEIEILTEIM